ncbi:MAG: hypothetical protein AAGK47_03345 [Bacteroidota bacterium]
MVNCGIVGYSLSNCVRNEEQIKESAQTKKSTFALSGEAGEQLTARTARWHYFNNE